jgi:hypothetical protein
LPSHARFESVSRRSVAGAPSSAIRTADDDASAAASPADPAAGADPGADPAGPLDAAAAGALDAAAGPLDTAAAGPLDAAAGALAPGFARSAPHSRQNRLISSYDVRQRGHSKRCAGVDDIGAAILALALERAPRTLGRHRRALPRSRACS